MCTIFQLIFGSTDADDSLDIYEIAWYRTTFRFIKQVFIGLLNFYGSLPTKCLSLKITYVKLDQRL